MQVPSGQQTDSDRQKQAVGVGVFLWECLLISPLLLKQVAAGSGISAVFSVLALLWKACCR